MAMGVIVGEKQRVAILGGGVGGVTTAFALTSTPDLRDRFDVTIYQRGWRLGGKGASGRNATMGQRIEEHGLHVWFGFYDNAFRLIDDCYRELDRPTTSPLHSRATAFTPRDTTVLFQRIDNEWFPWTSVSPRNPIPVGTDEGIPIIWDLLASALNAAADRWSLLLGRTGPPERHPFPSWVTKLVPTLNLAGRTLASVFQDVVECITTIFEIEIDDRHPLICKLLTHIRDWLWKHYAADRQTDHEVRIFFTGFDAVVTAAVGMLTDDLVNQGFTSINHLDLTEWLQHHGLHDITAGATFEQRAPALRAIYDMAFCFIGGDINRPQIAAGTALRNMILLSATKNEALFFKMNAGMGDAIFAPYYEVLKQRGVTFEFFHWVDALRTDGNQVTSIEIIPQVGIRGTQYQPLIEVQGLPCWPNEPDWQQLVLPETVDRLDANLEFTANPLQHDTVVLRQGVDFDAVVLAIPVGALQPICRELSAANPRFATMLDSSRTAMTQAFQLWMLDDAETLGWATGNDSLSGSFVEPLDTYSDMSHTLEREYWNGDEAPKSVGYFCGAMLEQAGHSLDQSTALAKQAALDFIENDLHVLWPNAFDANKEFRWDKMFDPNNGTGPKRLDSQYWRANADPSERYVLTPPLLVNDRLGAHESGFANLYLSGDWTRNGLDAGCVEAATISGLQAARAISDHPFHIVAEDDRWLTNRTP